MILVDTSVWVEHLRSGHPVLPRLLDRGLVLGHPWITGELALGNLANRTEVLGLLGDLAQASVATDDEVRDLIGRRRLHGRGIGWVDAALLAATILTADARLMTADRRLADAATDLGLLLGPAGR